MGEVRKVIECWVSGTVSFPRHVNNLRQNLRAGGRWVDVMKKQFGRQADGGRYVQGAAPASPAQY